MKILRDYQSQAMDGNAQHPGIYQSLIDHDSALVVMATGLGKTVIIAKTADEWKNGNVLCLAHRIELLDQMADTLGGELGYRPSIEQGMRGSAPEDLFAAGHIVVGSIQSMITRKRLQKFRDHPFGLVIIDEAHRATSPSYVKLVDRLRELDPNCKVLGVTATPNRTDGTALGLIFRSVAFDMGINQGIDAGWLVQIRQKFAVVEDLDLSKVPCTRNEFGEMDFKQADLQALLSQEGPLHAMSRPVLDLTPDGEQGIIFTASVSHAHLWAAVLNHYRPGCAAAIDGTMAKGEGQPRTETVKRFKDGDIQFLLNFNIATEGFDAPGAKFVIMGRPTKSLLVKTQQLGRVTRPLPGVVDGLKTPEERQDAIAASAKPFATALDFVGNLRGDVATVTDILGGNYDVDVRKAADEIIGAQKGNANVLDALNKARASMLLEAEELKRRPMRNVIQKADVKYHVGDLNKFDGRNGHSKPSVKRGGSTDGQIAGLVNLGIDKDTAMQFGRKQAGAVLNKLRSQRCTIPQANTLKKYGINPAGMNYDQAHEQIQKIADNGWKRP